MLVSSLSIKPQQNPSSRSRSARPQPTTLLQDASQPSVFVSDKDQTLIKAIGLIAQGTTTHYYSFGNFNLVRLVIHLLKQTGPAHVFLSSYSFSTKSIQQLHNLLDKQHILSFKVLLDNRVRSISPKPFQLISTMFNYRCTSVHAKTALIYNDSWQITIVTSQNATDNPKMERGIIYTDPQVFHFDFQNLSNAFFRGTT